MLRFGKTQFMRVLPDTCTVKETWDYADVEHILVQASQLVLRFKSGKEPQHITSPRVAEIVEIVLNRCAALVPEHTPVLERK